MCFSFIIHLSCFTALSPYCEHIQDWPPSLIWKLKLWWMWPLKVQTTECVSKTQQPWPQGMRFFCFSPSAFQEVLKAKEWRRHCSVCVLLKQIIWIPMTQWLAGTIDGLSQSQWKWICSAIAGWNKLERS